MVGKQGVMGRNPNESSEETMVYMELKHCCILVLYHSRVKE